MAVGPMESRRSDALHAERRFRKITKKLSRTQNTWRVIQQKGRNGHDHGNNTGGIYLA